MTLIILNADIFLERRKKWEYDERIRPTWDLLKDTDYPAQVLSVIMKNLISTNENVLLEFDLVGHSYW